MSWLMVALGGALGSVLRFGLGLLGELVTDEWPVGTMAANLLGSLLLGVVFVWAEDKHWLSVDVRTILGIGVMGGFTTYSTFNLEALRFLQAGEVGRAAAYVTLTLVVCLGAGLLGLELGRVLR